MTRQFVLVAAVPGREQSALDSLAAVEGVVARRSLRSKVEGCDVLALVEAPDPAAVEALLADGLPAAEGVHSVRAVTDKLARRPELSALITEMEFEVGPERK